MTARDQSTCARLGAAFVLACIVFSTGCATCRVKHSPLMGPTLSIAINQGSPAWERKIEADYDRALKPDKEGTMRGFGFQVFEVVYLNDAAWDYRFGEGR